MKNATEIARLGYEGLRKSVLLNEDISLYACYACGMRKARDHTESVTRLRTMADGGHQISQHVLGLKCLEGTVEGGPTEAARWFRLAAKGGHPPARASLGELYRVGRGVDVSGAEARMWYEMAPEHAVAQHGLGCIYRDGLDDVSANEKKAARLLRSAAKQDYPPALLDYAKFLCRGDSLDLDFEEKMTESLQYSLKAAEMETEEKWMTRYREEIAEAQWVTANHLNRLGSEGPSEVLRWARAAAKNGHKKAAAHFQEVVCDKSTERC